jgi:hypothetical protein
MPYAYTAQRRNLSTQQLRMQVENGRGKTEREWKEKKGTEAKGKIEKNLIEKKEFTDAPARREEIFKNGLRIIRFKMCMDANNVLKP